MITRPRRVVTERAVVLGLVIGVLVGGLVAGRPAIISRPAVQPTIVALSGPPIDLPRADLPDSGAASVATSTPIWAPPAPPTATRTVMPAVMPTATLLPTATPTATAPPPTTAPTPSMSPTAAATATLAPTPEPSPVPPPTPTDVPSRNGGVGAAAAAGVAPDAAAAVAAAAAGDPAIAALATRINQVRVEAGRAALTWSPELANAARMQAEDMAAHGFVSHTGSDGSDVVERMRRVGYDPAFRGEIIAWAPGGPETAFDWWWHSDLHHNTMLGAAYRDFGIAHVPHPTRAGHNYFVVVFGQR